MYKYLAMLPFIIAASFTHAASPVISVGSLHEYMTSDKTNLLKRVRNTGDATAFVRITVTEIEIVNGKEIIVNESKNADGQTSNNTDDTLIASPMRMIIPANGQQSTRLVFRGNREKERYFRVRFIPVAPEKMDEFNLDEEEAQAYAKSVSAGVNVFTGFGVVVVIQPTQATFNTQINETDKEVKVTNNGNTLIVLNNIKSCSKSDEHKCSASQRVHVRPQNSTTIEKQPNETGRFELVEGNQRKLIQFAQ